MVRAKMQLPIDAIADLCRRYGVERLAVFGSALRDDFGPSSDIDFLVRFKNDDYGPWMGKLMDLEEELAALLRRDVDLVSWNGIEQSRNALRRTAILESAQVVYQE
jgi:hypothetical protein